MITHDIDNEDGERRLTWYFTAIKPLPLIVTLIFTSIVNQFSVNNHKQMKENNKSSDWLKQYLQRCNISTDNQIAQY